MILVGTSGWQYRHWRGEFYPPAVPSRDWLGFYASQFATVEVNNAFYRLPDRSVFEAWRHATPEGFTMAVKASRYLTHIRRLREPAEPVARLMSRADALGDRLGPVLLQLPPNLPAEPARLDETLAAFPAGVRVAVEPRHPSWWTGQVRAVLERRGAALCWADRRSRPVTPLWRTADFGYLRLHEGRATPWPRYGRAALDSWLARLHDNFGNAPAFVYFNNDQQAAAISDARALASRATTHSLR
ncbi:DUF72 domain-containing protein [Natronosporangium hydrolyticum]|uniref:DUF72 domain-containing protein n=2 Tax=Natronosporangium hydrolyticum TaxID=2811111 RepID=A0A895YHR5_9ACTN|nr:DUF72 domain-containing protein [Natronosporangium hydrolyticum]